MSDVTNPDKTDRSAGVRLAIAGNIRAERARARLSQQQVADTMNDHGYRTWHKQTVSDLEGGKRTVAADELITLAEVLGTTPETLWRVPVTQDKETA